MLYQFNAICWKKNLTQFKNSNKKIDSWVFVRIGLCTKWSSYEIIPRRVYVVWNDSSACVCRNSGTTSYKKILVRSDSYAFVRNGLPCTKWSLLEMVFVRSDLTPAKGQAEGSENSPSRRGPRLPLPCSVSASESGAKGPAERSENSARLSPALSLLGLRFGDPGEATGVSSLAQP